MCISPKGGQKGVNSVKYLILKKIQKITNFESKKQEQTGILVKHIQISCKYMLWSYILSNKISGHSVLIFLWELNFSTNFNCLILRYFCENTIFVVGLFQISKLKHCFSTVYIFIYKFDLNNIYNIIFCDKCEFLQKGVFSAKYLILLKMQKITNFWSNKVKQKKAGVLGKQKQLPCKHMLWSFII